jgi:hypothetical protein
MKSPAAMGTLMVSQQAIARSIDHMTRLMRRECQFCVSGFSELHMKPVQASALK